MEKSFAYIISENTSLTGNCKAGKKRTVYEQHILVGKWFVTGVPGSNSLITLYVCLYM